MLKGGGKASLQHGNKLNFHFFFTTPSPPIPKFQCWLDAGRNEKKTRASARPTLKFGDGGRRGSEEKAEVKFVAVL